ncbi:MAG: 2-oxoglutarate dehydrogenase E1 component [Gammaproteobacteria bacterium]|nr:2-oxoglutarate dehydrogenase E1 component [Gammaproteobacteria bacterium]
MQKTSSLSDANAAYIEQLYENYLHDQNSVTPEWQTYFSQNYAGAADVSHAAVREHFLALGTQPAANTIYAGDVVIEQKQQAVTSLITAFRCLGHEQANIDPLNLLNKEPAVELTLAYHGLSNADLNTQFDAAGAVGFQQAMLKDIYAALQQTYCGSIGAEIMDITNTEQRNWLLEKFEADRGRGTFSTEQKKRLLHKLVATDGLEKYLSLKYVGQKRFSIEGADALIPLLDTLMLNGAKRGVKEIMVGMAHRGRLNVLVNFIGQEPADLFDEFAGKNSVNGSGDVKYHKGYSSNITTPDGTVHLALAYNPSHLEIINPIVEGLVYAKQWRYDDQQRTAIIPVLIHGDAAFSSQGVNQEVFNFSQVPGYATGGTIHIVTNNQVGFTTSANEGRSTRYCTDIAKMVEAPIFHVNGDDAEACAFTMQLLFEFRQRFKKDIVIDLVCYRRHGHQEIDEPTITQPVMYQVIKAHPTPLQVYVKQLVAAGTVTTAEVTAMEQQYRKALDEHQLVVEADHNADHRLNYRHPLNWKIYTETNWRTVPATNVSKDKLVELAHKLVTTGDIKLQPQVTKLMAARQKMADGEAALDWGFAETLAYATLLVDGYPIRISGEDARRGTFSHRHAYLFDQETNKPYIPLEHLTEGATKQAPFWVYNSILSEEGVMGFEVGYSAAAPDQLVIWEAQYGDFANGAQVVIDQFLSSGEQKWGQKSGLVLFLPHAHEGDGPEHTSARLERYLQLCAQGNMFVIMPTTPAQAFHMLRRHMLYKMRKPLIVMTPKGMLRSPLAVSTLDDLANGQFQAVIGETDADIKVEQVKTVILCSGKVYYNLVSKRREEKIIHTAIIRVEQLYPFPDQEIAQLLTQYKNATQIMWVQEEPKNQGSWYALQDDLRLLVNSKQTLTYVGRPAMASPAVGYSGMHAEQQKKLIAECLGLTERK